MIIVAGILMAIHLPVAWGIALCTIFVIVGFFLIVFGISLCTVLMDRNKYVNSCKVLCCACTRSSQDTLEMIYLNSRSMYASLSQQPSKVVTT